MTGFQGTAEQVLGEELCPEDLQRLENACWSVLLKGMETTSAQGPLARERLPMDSVMSTGHGVRGAGCSPGSGSTHCTGEREQGTKQAPWECPAPANQVSEPGQSWPLRPLHSSFQNLAEGLSLACTGHKCVKQALHQRRWD